MQESFYDCYIATSEQLFFYKFENEVSSTFDTFFEPPYDVSSLRLLWLTQTQLRERFKKQRRGMVKNNVPCARSFNERRRK